MWEERFTDHKEMGDCLELALSSHVVENNLMFGGREGGRGDRCYEHEEETKLNMISLAWDPSIQGNSNSSRNTLSLAHGFMDKTDDDISMVNEDHISLSSFPQQAQHATGHYPSLASEEGSTWCPKDALINTSSTRAHFNSSGLKPDQRSVGLMLKLGTEFSAGATASGESSWISPRLKEWPPKFAAIKHIKAKDSYNDQLDHQALEYGVGSRTATRVCVDCKTTKTPLWRSGPKGPKSLCNACGIRYRKARRALSAFGNTDHMTAVYNSRLPKRKQIGERVDKFVHLKKRSRLSIPSCKKNINVKFNGNPRVFAEDEKEAAVLLMALSCGLVHV